MKFKIKTDIENIPIAVIDRFRAFVSSKRFDVLGLNETDGAEMLRGYYEKYIGQLDSCTKCNRSKIWSILKDVVSSRDAQSKQ
mgnify:CR=1 FL=1|tara:strand:- start:309 stop:557 length:249 start_codon:yes stop_codon:yes gene_type:complete